MQAENKLQSYQVRMIKAAFARCYGLEESVKKDFIYAAKELAQQTGLKLSFIETNIEEIKTLSSEPV